MRLTAFLAATMFFCGVQLPAADPILMNMVMPDAKVLAGINVQKAKTSPFGQFVLTQISATGQDFTALAGLDPRTDVDEILVATNSLGPGTHTGLVLARGRFDAALITAALAKFGQPAPTTYAGAQLILSADPKKQGALAFIGSPSDILLAGDAVSVKAALDRRASINSIDPALGAKVMQFAAADAWTVSILPLANITHGPVAPGNPLQGAFNTELFKTVQQTSGSVLFSSPLQIAGEAVASNDKDASALGDVIRFLAAMLQTSTGPEAALARTLIQSLNVTTEGSTVKITLSIPEDQLEMLLKSAPHAAKAGRARI